MISILEVMMWHQNWRESIWSRINERWDLLIIGGGITGAGVLRQATAAGLRALLVEAHDFSFGTSSRSSKLVHGGFRYLLNKQFNVTKESVREREWLLREAPHLVTPLKFVLSDYPSYRIPLKMFGQGMVIYDLLAPKWAHRRLTPEQILRQMPRIRAEEMLGGYEYYDAAMDDSRLVLRVLREAVMDGGTALNYARVLSLLQTREGKVSGVVLKDEADPHGRTVEIKAGVVVNASGPWTDVLRVQLGLEERIRKLRGSHLVFSRARIPVDDAITLIHPRDRRALFVIPWEGTTVIGTTDLDHPAEMENNYTEPYTTAEEVEYLLEAGNFILPDLALGHEDILSTFSGLRPTLRPEEGVAPSKVSRAHALWEEQGMITITGGKYTTFRLMSRQTVEAVLAQLGKPANPPRPRIFNPLPEVKVGGMVPMTLQHLLGRHGEETAALLDSAHEDELERIGVLPNIWAELRWAAREEGALHLDDLLLRRVRLGMLLPEGARAYMPRIRKIVQGEMGWNDHDWSVEEKTYWQTWQHYYSPKPG